MNPDLGNGQGQAHGTVYRAPAARIPESATTERVGGDSAADGTGGW